MKVLVVGSGAREHAITAALARSPQKPQLLCFGSNNNPGIAALCSRYGVGKITDPAVVVAFAQQHGAELAVIGPEAPLASGVSDALRAAGVPCVGPSQALAQIESSKAFALELLRDYGVAGVPEFQTFEGLDGAREYLETLGEGNYVVKADGLCGGKGVKVAGAHLANIGEALSYCEECLPKFVLCEKLQGEEFSLLSFCDGDHLAHMPAVQDHKRAYEGDKGPNTGGMGSYSCADHLLPFLSAEAVEKAQAINKACVLALKDALGEGFKGILYGGYMLTPDRGVMLIEFNCRFGDPECLNLLSLLEPSTDFAAVCAAMASGGLKQVPVSFAKLASCCKYAVPEGYPDKPLKNSPIDLSGLTSPDLAYYGAVDKTESGQLLATGSRAVAVVCTAEALLEAEAKTEAEVSSIKGKVFHRTDIGKEALVASRVAHMLALRAAAHAPTDAPPVNVAVLGSTRGSAMQPLLRAVSGGTLRGVKLALVLSNKADAPILARAAAHGVPSAHVPVAGRSREAYDAELTARLEAAGVQLVLLVGWMRVLSPVFCKRWERRAVNCHPSLLPRHAGLMDLQVHASVLKAGDAESGCTVHLVAEEVDAGEVLVQKRCPVLPGDTPETLKARVQPLEGPAYITAVARLVAEIRKPAPAAPAGADGALTYKTAGVDITAGNELVDAIKPMAGSTTRPGAMGGLGGFGALFDCKAAGYADPVLVSGTDGVGTKLMVAQATGQHEHIGVDLVAMVVNDLVVQGAEPLFFLDYFATGALKQGEAQAVVQGIARGCQESGCVLSGGETAEMPGMYGPGHYDLAGFGVGAVERGELLPKLELLAPGDVLLGLPSNGVHANGFSLVRKVVEREGLGWAAPAPFDGAQTLASALLAPTRLYIKSCLPAVKTKKVKALAHITGGGLLENIPRVLPKGVAAALEASCWQPGAVFAWLANKARNGTTEMLRTFNCGLGMVLVVAPEDEAAVLEVLRANGEPGACRVGTLAPLAPGAEQVTVSGDVPALWGWPAL